MERLSDFKSAARVLLGLLLLASFLVRQDCAAAPKAEVPALTVDLGDWLYYKQAEFAFSIKNTGDAGLEATVEKTSCGCTVALPPDKALPPGSEGTIKLQYRPKQDSKRLGPQDFTAMISTNDPGRPKFLLSLKLRLVEPVAAYPPTLEFKVLASDSGLVKEHLVVKCFRDEGLPEILSIESTASAIAIVPVKKEDSATGKAHDYEVTFDPRQTGSSPNGAVVIKTDSSRTPVLEIPIKVTKDWPITFSPKSLLFGVVKSNTTSEKSTHTTSSEIGFEPGTAVCSDARISSKLSATPEGKWEIVAALKVGEAGAQPERIDTAIDVLDKNQRKIGEVPVKGIVAAGAK